MFFYLSKIFSGLMFPLPLILITLASSWFFYKKKWARKTLGLAIATLFLLSLYPVSGILIGGLEGYYSAQKVEDYPDVDAVVLLGGMINPMITSLDGDPEFVDSVDRMLLAQKMMHQKKAPWLIISGGSGLLQQGGEREGELLARFLIDRQFVSANQILVEKESRNTYENARFSAVLAKKYQIKKILLITSAFHIPRSVLCFEAQGFEVVAVPTDYYYTGNKNLLIEAIFPAAAALRISTISIKEYFGLVAYKLAGYY